MIEFKIKRKDVCRATATESRYERSPATKWIDVFFATLLVDASASNVAATAKSNATCAKAAVRSSVLFN